MNKLMHLQNISTFTSRLSSYLLLLLLAGCFQSNIRPISSFNDSIFKFSSSYREPSLGNQWLVALTNSKGKDMIEMINIRSRTRVALPGINRADSQPISVSVSANGERLALIRQRDDQTELFIYRRSVGTLQRIELTPKGIPRRVSLDSSGRVLAVQVSRDGRWDIDVIRLPG